MSNETSSDATVAQVKKNFDSFVKEVKGRCEEAKFTKKQVKEMTDFCKGLKPSTESIEVITAKFSDIAEENARAHGATEKDITKGRDFQQFIKILQVTEGLPEKFDDETRDKVMDKFEVWLKDDKPTPAMPKTSTEVEEILRIYRRKWKGKQFISYVVKGKDEQVGMRTDILYGKDGDGNEDTSLIVGRDRYPVLEYTEKLARELVKKAKRYNPDGTVELRFHYQNQPKVVNNEENFFGDFDKLIAKAFNNEMI